MVLFTFAESVVLADDVAISLATGALLAYSCTLKAEFAASTVPLAP